MSQMDLRMAGSMAGAAGAGALGAFIASRMTEGPAPRMAGELETLPGEAINAPQVNTQPMGIPAAMATQQMNVDQYMVERAYGAINADPEISREDRMTAALVLTGKLPPGGAGVKVGDSPGGRKAIETAGQIKKADGILASQVGSMMMGELGMG